MIVKRNVRACVSLLLACAACEKSVPLAADALRPTVVTQIVLNDSDDPAIWVDTLDPARSLILGTDKGDTTGGVYVFDLDGRIDTVRLRQVGYSIEVRPILGLVLAEAQPLYAQAIVEALAFFAPGSRWNIALRLNGGVTTAVPTQLRYYIGGLDKIRGYIDNYLRTDLYLVANAELRVILFDGFADWLAIMAVAFADGVIAHAEASGLRGAASVGVGIRLLVPKFPRSGLRIDLAEPLQLHALPQVSFGAFQFF